MNIWTALVAIVAIGSTVGAIAILGDIKTRTANTRASSKESDTFLRTLSERVGLLEERMTNIETILVDREKAGRYENL